MKYRELMEEIDLEVSQKKTKKDWNIWKTKYRQKKMNCNFYLFKNKNSGKALNFNGAKINSDSVNVNKIIMSAKFKWQN